MKYAPRFYSCVLCHAQVVICTYCDRGQIYCTKNCSKQARLKSCREANARYQQTPKGRRLHAARQKLYRLRQIKKVTDHGSKSSAEYGLLEKVKNKTGNTDLRHISALKKCCYCQNHVLPYFRMDFLRHDSRNLSYFRPP